MHAVHVYKRIDTAFLDKMPRDSGIPDPATMAEWSPWDASGRRNNRGSRQEFKIEPAVPTVRRIFGRNPRSNSSPLPSPPSSLPPATWNLCTLDWKSTRWLVSAKGSSFISFSFFPFFSKGEFCIFRFIRRFVFIRAVDRFFFFPCFGSELDFGVCWVFRDFKGCSMENISRRVIWDLTS